MVVLIRALLKIALALSLKCGWEPRIVTPVQLNHFDERISAVAITRLDRRILARRVPSHPKLGVPAFVFLAQRRFQRNPRCFRHWLGLVDPADQDATLGLDARNAAIQTGE